MAKNNQVKQVNILNDKVYQAIYNRLKMKALSVFRWEGFPESVDVEYIEDRLYEKGKACVVYDNDMGYLALDVLESNYVNVNGRPTKARAIGVKYNKDYDVYIKGADNSTAKLVIIKNNRLKRPTKEMIEIYANKIYEIERALDVNINATKTPFIIVGNDKDKLTLSNIFRQIRENEPAIYVDPSLDPDAFKSLSTEAPFLADKLQALKKDIYNECMTFLGINNVETEKKEHLVVDEINANNDAIANDLEVMQEARQVACEYIKDLFGLNVSVYNVVSPTREEIEEEELEEEEESED